MKRLSPEKLRTLQFGGYAFASIPLHDFGKDSRGFLEELHDQDAALERIALNGLETVQCDGTLVGPGNLGSLQVSQRAFSDICQFSKAPASFLQQLARWDGPLAERAVAEAVKHNFHQRQEKIAVVDGRTRAVLGVVGAETYSPVSSFQLVQGILDNTPGDMHFSQGWIEGPYMRCNMLSKKEKPDNVGDVVSRGVFCSNGIAGNAAVRFQPYIEKLACLNGMILSEALGGSFRERHTGDFGDLFDRIGVILNDAFGATQRAVTSIQEAAQRRLSPDQLETLALRVSRTELGGKRLAQRALDTVLETTPRPTLWDFVNALTVQAHSVSLNRREEIERLGSELLTLPAAA